MLTKREVTLGGLIAVFVFLAGYLVGQNVARRPDQTDEILNLKLQNFELQRKIAAPSASQDQADALQVNAEAETAAAQQLQSKLDEANRRAQEQAETVIDLQHQLDQANALVQQEADEALDAEQERDAQQPGGTITPAIEAARIHAVQQVDAAACRARLLNVEAQIHLLPKSGPAAVLLQIVQAAIAQREQAQTAAQSGAQQ